MFDLKKHHRKWSVSFSRTFFPPFSYTQQYFPTHFLGLCTENDSGINKERWAQPRLRSFQPKQQRWTEGGMCLPKVTQHAVLLRVGQHCCHFTSGASPVCLSCHNETSGAQPVLFWEPEKCSPGAAISSNLNLTIILKWRQATEDGTHSATLRIQTNACLLVKCTVCLPKSGIPLLVLMITALCSAEGLSRIVPSLCSDISCLQLAALVSAGSLSAAQENIWKE